MRGTSIRRSTWLVALLLVAGSVPQSYIRASAADIGRDPQPNIILLLTDDQTFDSMSQGLPFLDSRPAGHWIELSNAFLNVPLCCPSRATILSGLYAHHSGVRANQEGGAFNESSTMATWLQGAGYRTGYVGKYLNHYPFGRGPYVPAGWTDWFGLYGPTAENYYGYTVNDNGTLVTYGSTAADYQTDVLAARAESFITSSTAPFFLTVAPVAPHVPATPAPRHNSVPMTVTRSPNFNEADVSDKPAWVQARPLSNDSGMSQWDANRRKIFRALRAVDELFARMYSALQSTEQLDTTVIVFMTDNGVTLGEHRLSGKSCVYEECIGTPMLVRYPWADSRTESRLVSNVDLAPTFAELAGMVPPSPVDGVSLVPLLEDAEDLSWRSSILLEHFAGGGNPPFWAIRNHEWKYSELGTGERELYDLVADPYELQNVAGLPAYAAIQSQLASELAELKVAPARRILPSLSVGDAAASEAAGEIVVPVTLSLASSSTVTIGFATQDGTARAPDDYESGGGTLAFPPGAVTADVSIPIVDDAIAEPDESFTLVLSEPVDAQIDDGTGEVTISNDDTVPAIFVDDPVVAEGDAGTTSASFTVSLSAPVTEVVGVDYATSDGSAINGMDYVGTIGTVLFQPGEVEASVDVPVIGDNQGEPDETFFLDLTNASNAVIGDAMGIATISNDDPVLSLSIDDVSVTEGDAGATDATFTVSLSMSSAESVSVDYSTSDDTATGGSDYQPTFGTIVFEPGDVAEHVRVPVFGDDVYETTERFFVDLFGGTVWVTDSRGVGTIEDDEPLPALSVGDASVTEGNAGTTSLLFSAQLSRPSAFSIDVSFATSDGTARSPSDYVATGGTVTFAPGTTVQWVSVVVNGDTTFESGETFNLNLSSPSGASIADGQGRGTIVNDDRKT